MRFSRRHFTFGLNEPIKSWHKNWKDCNVQSSNYQIPPNSRLISNSSLVIVLVYYFVIDVLKICYYILPSHCDNAPQKVISRNTKQVLEEITHISPFMEVGYASATYYLFFTTFYNILRLKMFFSNLPRIKKTCLRSMQNPMWRIRG